MTYHEHVERQKEFRQRRRSNYRAQMRQMQRVILLQNLLHEKLKRDNDDLRRMLSESIKTRGAPCSVCAARHAAAPPTPPVAKTGVWHYVNPFAR